LFNSSQFGGIKIEPLRYSKFLLDLLRGVNSCLVLCTVYGCTVVQDQCSIVALYYCITSLPVYPNTVHGHCTTVLCGKYHHRGIFSWDLTEARNLIVSYYIIGGS
jgi:hypothetical protein